MTLIIEKQMKMMESGRWILLLLAFLIAITPVAAQQREAASPKSTIPVQQPDTKPAPNQPSESKVTPVQQSDAGEKEVTFDTLVPADSYGIYGEARMVGQQVVSGGVIQMFEPLWTFGGAPKEIAGLVEFLTRHTKTLTSARVLFATMPAKRGIPQGLAAIELPSSEATQKFIPELRAFLTSSLPHMAVPATQSDSDKSKAAVVHSQAKPESAAPFFIKHVGNLIIISDEKFTINSIRPQDSKLLSNDSKFQRTRNRFASETIFLYLDIGLMGRSAAQRRESYRLAQQDAQNSMQRAGVVVSTGTGSHVAITAPATPQVNDDTIPPEPELPEPEVIEEEALKATSGVAPVPVEPRETQEKAAPAEVNVEVRAPPPQNNSQVEMLMPLLMGAFFGGGGPQWPEAIGLAATMEGDTLIVRGLFSHTPGKPLNVIPLLPSLISGSPLAYESSSLMPADTAVFISASLDIPQIYDALFAAMRGQVAAVAERMAETGQAQGKPQEKQKATFESQVEAMEKLLGFKIKEDLLASLGNEVAVSVPPQWLVSHTPTSSAKSSGPQPSQPGLVFLISLRDKEKLRTILPRAMGMLSLIGMGGQPLTEKRGDVEIINYGASAYAFIGNFLASAPDVSALRYLADQYASSNTLAANSNFHRSMSWQPRQTLGQVYVSSDLMKGLFEDGRKAIDEADQETVNLLARFNLEPDAITHMAANDGDAVFHELHIPKNVITLWLAQDAAKARQAPLKSNEMMAQTALRSIAAAQKKYQKSKGSFAATLDDLKETKELFIHVSGYEIKLSSSGNKFEATATPTDYGKTGRRSYYIDESAELRGADHSGKMATASDPSIR